MYAAAGGASCRNARRRQAQQALKDKQAAQKAAKEKLSHSKAHLVATPTRSKQFHQLPANYYLRTPISGMRKLSAGYTSANHGGSKLLLPISEQSAQQHSPSHQQLSTGQRHQSHHQPHTPSHHHPHHREMHLDVGGHHKTLTKSATASFPLVSQAETPPGTHLCPFHHPQQFRESQANLLSLRAPAADGGIIITPATPLPSPSPSDKREQQVNASMQELRESAKAAPAEEEMPEFPLERTCSVYRNRRLDAENPPDEEAQLQQQFYTMPNGHTTDKDFCDAENRACICTCDRVECAQGRQAWLERRRCSVQDPNQASYRRWVKHNRVQDASLGGSSDDEDILGVIRGPSTFANAFLYIGLGTISLGSIIFFVGTGEKGFKTQELRLIGPALAAIGLIFCIIRILFCVCPSHCISKRERNKKSAKVDADHRTSLLGDTKRVSIARGPYINSKIPMSSSQSSQFPPKSIVKNKSYEGVEALRQIASTSLFLDNEQKINGGALGQHTIPTIREPTDEGSSNASLINLMPQAHDALLEPPIEMMKMETLKVDTLNIIDILSLTDSETERELRQIDINQEVVIPRVEPTSLFDDDAVRDELEIIDDILMNDTDGEVSRRAKLNRQRTSINQSKAKDADTLLMETSLMIIDSEPPPPPPHSPPPFSPPPPLPLSPNIVTTTTSAFNIPSTSSLTLPLTSTTTATTAAPSDEPGVARRTHRHHHHHHHHHKGGSSQHHRHRRTATTTTTSDATQPIKDAVTEAELVLSPSKLGQ